MRIRIHSPDYQSILTSSATLALSAYDSYIHCMKPTKLCNSSSVIVEAIPALLEKLQVIQCMDVAEQSLTALKMLSKKHHKAILHARGVPACLMYLDFFSISAQNKALTVTAHCCQGLLPEEFGLVQESLPILATRLAHEDKTSVELACMSLARLVDSYKLDTAKLAQVARPVILTNLQRLLVSQPAQPALVTPNTFTLCLHILVVLASNSPTISLALLRQDLGRTLHQLLVADKTLQPSTSSSSSSSKISTSLVQDHEVMDLVPRSGQELYEMTCLVGELLPPLPGDGVFAVDGLLSMTAVRDPMVWQWQDDRGAWHTYGHQECRAVEAAFLAGESEVILATSTAAFSLNLVSRHEIREDTGTARSVKSFY